jgi:hypothetical protein
MGLTLAAVLFPIVNQTLWRVPDDRPALDWRRFGVLAAFLLALDLAILAGFPFVLYPAAVISTLGVFSLLIIVFGILWITLMRQENAFEAVRQMWLPAAAGVTLSLILVLGIDFLRYQLTGTWSGFPGLG